MLKRVKESFAAMYESEILNFNGDEYRTLSFLRVKAGGENGVVWYSKESLRECLNIGRNKLNSILDTLEDHGAIIIFNAKDDKTKRNCSNVYYITEYDSINKEYITANTIDEIKRYALDIRQQKELEYSIKNNLEARSFILEERLSADKRKVKHYKKSTEKPTTENRHLEPTTENRHYLNNKNILNNNNNNENVVVEDNNINLVKNYISKNLTNISYDEAKIITNDLINTEKQFSLDILKSRLDAIKNYKGNIKNIIGMLRKSIKERWTTLEHNNNKFTDYEGQRNYDYDSLEKKLLGWE